MNALSIIPRSAESEVQLGRVIFDGETCQYADQIRPGDLVSADFDKRQISSNGGLYLVEALKEGQPVWRGCRRMMRVAKGISVDQNGRGDWVTVKDLDAIGWRVAGTVLNVYAPR